jgi:hypothetical protein
MSMKYTLAVTLVVPFMMMSSMAQEPVDQHVYQGGPKTSIPHATRHVTSSSGAFAMVPFVAVPGAKHSHIYQSGPKTVMPHSY